MDVAKVFFKKIGGGFKVFNSRKYNPLKKNDKKEELSSPVYRIPNLTTNKKGEASNSIFVIAKKRLLNGCDKLGCIKLYL